MYNSRLAINGGEKAVKTKMPHFVWPPSPDKGELNDLVNQRKSDISIKGRTGPIKEFEDRFLEFLDHKLRYAITFNSGTSALLAAYFSLFIQEDDEVIVPVSTFHAAVSPLMILRGVPVFVDVDYQTRCINPILIENVITKRTKAILLVHQWGHPCDMDKIMPLAKKYNLKVIEDCSHAHGSTYKGKMVGTFGDVSIFSLQAAKMLFAGEGGILVTNNEEIHDRATLLGHYRDRSNEEIKNSFYHQFWVTGYGLKLRMSSYNAVTAIHSLKMMGKRIKSRNKCLHYFNQRLAEFSEIEPHYVDKKVTMGAWYGFKPLYKSDSLRGLPREEYVRALNAEGVDIHTPSAPPLITLPLYFLKNNKMFRKGNSRVKYNPSDFPVASALFHLGLSLPTFTDWDKSKMIIDQYVEAFRKVHDHYSIKYSLKNHVK